MPSPYENDESIKKDFSHSEVDILIKISFILEKYKDKEFYEQELVKEFKFSKTRLSPILGYLKKINIVKVVKTIGKVKILFIDSSLLKHFIDEQENELKRVEWESKFNKHSYKNY